MTNFFEDDVYTKASEHKYRILEALDSVWNIALKTFEHGDDRLDITEAAINDIVVSMYWLDKGNKDD